MYVCCIYGCPFSKRYSTLFVSYVQVLAGTVVPFEYQWDIVSHTKLTGSTSEQRKRLERPWGQPVTVVLVQTLLEDRHSKLFFYVLWVLSYLVAFYPYQLSTFCRPTLQARPSVLQLFVARPLWPLCDAGPGSWAAGAPSVCCPFEPGRSLSLATVSILTHLKVYTSVVFQSFSIGGRYISLSLPHASTEPTKTFLTKYYIILQSARWHCLLVPTVGTRERI